MEKETIEQEDEMMSAEADALLSELNSEIAYGESLGVFTASEAAEWYAGADACTKVVHLHGLLGYIGKFIASGEARLQKLEEAVDNELLTSSEQQGYLNEVRSSTYQARGRLIEETRSLIKKLKGLESQLVFILNRKNISPSAKGGFISKFYSAGSNNKRSVVKEAGVIKETEEQSELVANVKIEKRPEPLSAAPELPAEIKRDPKGDCIKLVEHYLKRYQFNQAADLIEASSRYFNLAEYRGLLKYIEKARLEKELPDLQAQLRAA